MDKLLFFPGAVRACPPLTEDQLLALVDWLVEEIAGGRLPAFDANPDAFDFRTQADKDGLRRLPDP